MASDGTGYRLRGRVAHREMNETTIEVEGVTPLLGRFLRRFAPEPPLYADLGLLDETGTVYRRVQGRVRDLALAGAGIAAEGLQAGDQLQLTLTDGDGVPSSATSRRRSCTSPRASRGSRSHSRSTPPRRWPRWRLRIEPPEQGAAVVAAEPHGVGHGERETLHAAGALGDVVEVAGRVRLLAG